MGKNKCPTKYNRSWENPDMYPDLAQWIQAANSGQSDDIYHYECKICRTGRLKLSNMGVTSPKSHIKNITGKDGKVKESKHNQRMRLLNETKKDCFVTKSSSETSPKSSSTDLSVLAPSSSQQQVAGLQVQESSLSQQQPSEKTQSPLTMYLTNAPQEVLKAWILWCLHVVHSHQSVNSSGEKGDLFRLMFPDSKIAVKFGVLCSTKIAYIINHGIAPYFKKIIMNELIPRGPRLPPKFTSCFDESFNKATFSKQMDVHILYFNEKTKLIERVYIGSQFMGHATHTDTMEDFKKAHEGLDIVHNLVQVSMDGPHVNWAFMDVLAEYRKTQDPQSPELINIGSCGIHVLHGAYGTAQGVTDWEVAKTLKAAHGVFKKSPARRSDYLADNDLQSQENDPSLKVNFPLKFCGHRWLENGKAIDRFLEVVHKLSVFFVKSKDRKNFDKKDERFPLLLKNTTSKMFPVYCEFSGAICRDIEPFMTLFQAERPLASFLYAKLKDLLYSLLERIVKPEVLNKNKTTFKLLQLVKDGLRNKQDKNKPVKQLYKEENLLPLESINVGFAAKRILKKLTTTEKPLERTFRNNVRGFVVRLVEKVVERGPLQYKFTRSISALSPVEISLLKPETLINRFEQLVEELHEDSWITSLEAERAIKQYKTLTVNPDFILEAKTFNINEDRLDTFYSRILDSSSTTDLEYVVRLVLIMSHGNARVESGFSVNDDILLPNMLEETIVSQRLAYEGVQKAGGPTKVEITDDLMKSVRYSHKRFAASNEEKKKRQSVAQKKIGEKRKATIELKEVVARKKAAVSEMQSEISGYDVVITALHEKLRK